MHRLIAIVLLLAPLSLFAVEASPPPCAPLERSNTFLVFDGAQSGCGSSGASCVAGESITFRPAFLYGPPNCLAYTFAWDFGDGTQTPPGSGAFAWQSIEHVFATRGPHIAKLTITGSFSSFVLALSLMIAEPVPTLSSSVLLALALTIGAIAIKTLRG